MTRLPANAITGIWRRSVNRPTAAHLSLTRCLLQREGASESGAQSAAAAGRIHDKLHQHLGISLGASAVQALLERSAKAARAEFSFLGPEAVASSTALRERLAAEDAATALAAAAMLFALFLGLTSSFIGDRLIAHAINGAWPGLGAQTSWGDMG